jgi:hypothetical protein
VSGQSWRGRPPLSETFPRIRTPWKAVLAELRDAIGRGDMAPGARLPSMLRLSEAHGADLGTLLREITACGDFPISRPSGFLARDGRLPARRRHRPHEAGAVIPAARFALEVLRAFVMPWAAARTIREQRRDMHVLIRFAGDIVRTRPPAKGARPRLYRVK